MKSTVFVTSLALASSAESLAPQRAINTPRMLDLTKKLFREEHTLKKDKLNSMTQEMRAEAVHEELQAEGINMYQAHNNAPGKYFEMKYYVGGSGGSGCDDNMPSTVMSMAEGLQVGRCVNGIFIEPEVDNSLSNTMSYIAYEPNNGGFPIFTFFNDHGCVPNKAFHVERMNKVESGGFDKQYRVNQCAPFYEGGTIPAFYGQASWHDSRFEAHFSHVAEAGDTLHKACMNDKYFKFALRRADFCMQEDEGVYVKYNVDQCNGNTGKVVLTEYSDALCQTLTHTEDLFPEECLFDTDHFIEEYKDYQNADFLYRSQSCYKATPLP